MVNNVQDLDDLEQAIHYLKEAQQLGEGDEVDPIVANARLEMVDNAIESISNFVHKEKENSPFNTNPGP